MTPKAIHSLPKASESEKNRLASIFNKRISVATHAKKRIKKRKKPPQRMENICQRKSADFKTQFRTSIWQYLTIGIKLATERD